MKSIREESHSSDLSFATSLSIWETVCLHKQIAEQIPIKENGKAYSVLTNSRHHLPEEFYPLNKCHYPGFKSKTLSKNWDVPRSNLYKHNAALFVWNLQVFAAWLSSNKAVKQMRYCHSKTRTQTHKTVLWEQRSAAGRCSQSGGRGVLCDVAEKWDEAKGGNRIAKLSFVCHKGLCGESCDAVSRR